ncbi:putative glycoside hydrolase [Staphylococcus hominis]|uniref:putative glycoside hydrolase n=1 Tax=Staphylococcus hominis TaxID=1290 RepID=UPI00066EB661|nr:putative glycoside hydrolase [Staphylococcus hominis]MCI2921116.1 putative glycoside hydrolase [Staphylococcus hominis]MDH9921529.1 putative glycoside hydrolase [Staphylococcus hominis]MDH9923769.1 putative glycoside hydrolase [Staphylococcus hominis]MDH9949325.1 putative glycoside hydrolase [Staphylococcus hominis]MDS3865712.1 putative glycoside hydrolase [Staphylococcus hominis]
MKKNKIFAVLTTSALLLAACSNGDNASDSGQKDGNQKNEQSSNQSGNSQSDALKKNNDKNTNENKVEYPKDGVKGIYVTSNSTQGAKMDELVKFIKDSNLNTMVIDVKDDTGNITMKLNTGNKQVDKNTLDIVDGKKLLKKLHDNNIYPIARIVTFKDTKLANEHPEWTFRNSDGSVWTNGKGDSFVNPFMKEVWKYDIDVAKAAAKAGFQDIQFDYVRFPEGFENQADSLTYNKGEYKNSQMSSGDQRVDTITKFLEYANKELKPMGVNVSADVFGYSALVENAPGIGQSFPKISKNVDAISSMIYPSHWSNGDFGLQAPDTEPYKTVNRYIQKENSLLDTLGKDKPISRPWIQDFTASYLGAGNYIDYDAKAISEEVQALKDNGVNEFLLWNAGNDYTEGVNYNPKKGNAKEQDPEGVEQTKNKDDQHSDSQDNEQADNKNK